VGAALIYEHLDDDDVHNIPIAFITSADFPKVTNGAGFTLNEHANGLFEIEGVS
jgi:hypothetical protein